jgi:hypothetical protein
MPRRARPAGVVKIKPAEGADTVASGQFSASQPGDSVPSKMPLSGSGVGPQSPAIDIRMRQIRSEDIAAVAETLHRGFPDRSKDYFLAALHRLNEYEPPKGAPQFGFLLAAGTMVVGALLAISSFFDDGEHRSVRCNVACWYVYPQFRVYAPLLILQVARNRAVTYTNISAATGTWDTIEAQGFCRFSTGAFAGVPALAAHRRHVKVSDISAAAEDADGLAPHELKILKDHEQFGCMSLVCVTAEGAYPFVFRRRQVSRFPLPCAQLIYCRDLRDLSRFAGPIGRFLVRKGMTWLLVATSRPIENIVGKYFQSKMPMYFKGPTRPLAGDLAYTEAALFGF